MKTYTGAVQLPLAAADAGWPSFTLQNDPLNQ